MVVQHRCRPSALNRRQIEPTWRNQSTRLFFPSLRFFDVCVCSVKVAYRVPGAPTADWVDIYNRLYRERIIFLGQEIDDELANQIIGVLLVRL